MVFDTYMDTDRNVPGTCAYSMCECQGYGIGGESCGLSCPVPQFTGSDRPCGEGETIPWGQCVPDKGAVAFGYEQGRCECFNGGNPAEGCALMCTEEEECSANIDTPVEIETLECDYANVQSIEGSGWAVVNDSLKSFDSVLGYNQTLCGLDEEDDDLVGICLKGSICDGNITYGIDNEHACILDLIVHMFSDDPLSFTYMDPGAHCEHGEIKQVDEPYMESCAEACLGSKMFSFDINETVKCLCHNETCASTTNGGSLMRYYNTPLNPGVTVLEKEQACFEACRDRRDVDSEFPWVEDTVISGFILDRETGHCGCTLESNVCSESNYTSYRMKAPRCMLRDRHLQLEDIPSTGTELAFFGVPVQNIKCTIFLPDSMCNFWRGKCECAQPFTGMRKNGVPVYLNPHKSYRVALMQGYDIEQYVPFMDYRPPIPSIITKVDENRLCADLNRDPVFEEMTCTSCFEKALIRDADKVADANGTFCFEYEESDCGTADVQQTYFKAPNGVCESLSYYGTNLSTILNYSVCEEAAKVFGEESILNESSGIYEGCMYDGNQVKFMNFVPRVVARAGSLTQEGSSILGEESSDFSGQSLAMSKDGKVIAIGAHRHEGAAGRYSGHVRVYEFVSGTWQQRGSDVEGGNKYDQSGFSVDLNEDGTVMVVGAQLHDVRDDSGSVVTSSVGHVRIFDWTVDGWVQRGSDVEGDLANDKLGYSVSLSGDGNTVAVGIPYKQDTTPANIGRVTIYYWDEGWQQKGSYLEGSVSSDYIGKSISLSADGNRIAYIRGGTSDIVNVFTWENGDWGSVKSVQLDYSSNVDLSPDGSTLAIGARGALESGMAVGNVKVFEFNVDGDLVQRGEDLNDFLLNVEGGEIGSSVSLSKDGTSIAISAQKADSSTLTNTGHVVVFDWIGGSWRKRSDILGSDAGGEIGHVVKISEDGFYLAFSSVEVSNRRGEVKVYSWESEYDYSSKVECGTNGLECLCDAGEPVFLFDSHRDCVICGGGEEMRDVNTVFRNAEGQCVCSNHVGTCNTEAEGWEHFIRRDVSYTREGNGICEVNLRRLLQSSSVEEKISECATFCDAKLSYDGFAITDADCRCVDLDCETRDHLEFETFRFNFRSDVETEDLVNVFETGSTNLRCYKDVEHTQEVSCDWIRALKHFARGTSYRSGDCSVLAPGADEYYQTPCSGHGFSTSGTCACDYAEEFEIRGSGAGLSFEAPNLRQTPFRGKDCSVVCPGYDMKSMQSVCSGHGLCTADGRCDCEQGFTGRDCSLSCEIDPGPLTCSGHGTCDERLQWHRADIRDLLNSTVCKQDEIYLSVDKVVSMGNKLYYIKMTSQSELETYIFDVVNSTYEVRKTNTEDFYMFGFAYRKPYGSAMVYSSNSERGSIRVPFMPCNPYHTHSARRVCWESCGGVSR